MASPRFTRTMRGAITASAVAVALSLVPSPASGTPDTPANSSEAAKQYAELSTQAEQLTEEWLKAQDDLKGKEAELDKANADAAAAVEVGDKARAGEEQFRGQVDQLTSASFQGARLNQLSALLTSNSAQNFLDQMSALDVLANDNNDALKKLTAVTRQAKDAESKAAEAQATAKSATDAAAAIAADLDTRKQAMDVQIAQVKAQLGKLTAADKAALRGNTDSGNYLAPPGVAGQAMQVALGKRGSDYVWGATGPNTFDCSGLVYWSYQQFGVTLPRSSSAQSGAGKPVSRDQLQPGDLVFYGRSNIHHVGIYVGDGKMVHAPQSGDVVKVSPLQSDYATARRISE